MEYEVERILRHRKRKGRGRSWEFLVLWRGFDIASATWEPERHLAHAPERVAEYWASLS